ncbi:MAG: 30S ribosomal protein S18 [Elusimicrobiota bacterium]|nr:30S ribosomal protein S18 [Endomicrobiia bacterium]MCX7911083.1 30S ribosomal protein S18 [Endomicrobiia bacterium]MDW8166279.1 30S ribosomal protein S18 [Elusimicrobiota bacterium]
MSVYQKKVVKNKVPKCHFCATKTEPDYKNTSLLKSFISEKFKILPRRSTKLCAKHQNRVAKEIKYARILALLPFVPKYK